ncbi:hypothetical protein ACOYW6_06345 [Parablastomonas sp. CN1-191]|uniref:hypothetical protein n=1 Tax=Parablastomonas sp. CN1-191 TaxID=3400908 RepID=UPI003BF84BA7
MRRLLIFAALLPLAACGQRAELRPPAGTQQPVAYGAGEAESADRLLTPPPQAGAERNVELRRRSERRADDPFDLPPPEGPGLQPVPLPSSSPATPAPPQPTPTA